MALSISIGSGTGDPICAAGGAARCAGARAPGLCSCSSAGPGAIVSGPWCCVRKDALLWTKLAIHDHTIHDQPESTQLETIMHAQKPGRSRFLLMQDACKVAYDWVQEERDSTIKKDPERHSAERAELKRANGGGFVIISPGCRRGAFEGRTTACTI